jgi:hypothetical protein
MESCTKRLIASRSKTNDSALVLIVLIDVKCSLTSMGLFPSNDGVCMSQTSVRLFSLTDDVCVSQTSVRLFPPTDGDCMSEWVIRDPLGDKFNS